MNDGYQKAHYLTTQQSKNYFEWRVKRSARDGNCTVRLTIDGINYQPLTPAKKNHFKFPCGRQVGYEQIEYTLPKNMVAEDGGVVQLEFETEYGTVVQCADLIIQPKHEF